jgi:ArsR family transcriptional regulator
MKFDDMQVKFFKALAHPIRLNIVRKLIKQNLCVCELKDDIEFSQSNLSQHLKILRDAGILNYKKDGLKVIYFILNKDIIQMLDLVEEIIKKNIENLYN